MTIAATVICGAFFFSRLNRVLGALNSHRLNFNTVLEFIMNPYNSNIIQSSR
jgi:hypothetical protein